MSETLRLLVIGAHPDDAEYKAGGLAALYRRAGHDVRFVSVTNGEAGHHLAPGPDLVRRRKDEAREAGAAVGLTYEVWDHPDGRLLPTLEVREQVIRLIRSYRPDLVLTHRPNDYHPDHRATSQSVQDAAYMLTVPAVCPDVPHLRRDPVIAYLSDEFTRPYPFEPTVVIDVGAVWDQKVAMLHAHRSQFYEWLPYNTGHADEVPEGDDDRRAWLSRRLGAMSGQLADRFRDHLVTRYGASEGSTARLVEAFEGCEYGAPLDAPARERLFPFGAATSRRVGDGGPSAQ